MLVIGYGPVTITYLDDANDNSIGSHRCEFRVGDAAAYGTIDGWDSDTGEPIYALTDAPTQADLDAVARSLDEHSPLA